MNDFEENITELQPEIVNVVAAIVKRDNTYLCVQRCRDEHEYISEHWEFPGGKCEEGESDHEALIREIKEEMDWDIYVGKKLGTVTYEYPDITICLTAYLCLCEDDNFKLLEHLDCRWLKKEELNQLEWTDADRELLQLIEE